MLRRIFVFIFLTFILCGCTRAQEKNVVTFSTWGSITETKIIKELITEFEKENPDIKIKLIHIPQNYFQKIHLLFASNTPPDVLFINNLNIPIYEKHLEDLSKIVEKKDFYQQSIDGLTYNNKLLAIPRDISNLVLYINLDKMDLPNENWSIEELLSSAQKTKDSNTFGISFEKDIYWAMPYLAYFGGDFINNNELAIESNNSKIGLNFYIDLRDKYKVAPNDADIGSSTLAQMFLDKKLVMYLSGRWMYPIITQKADFNWAVINFPYGRGEQLCDVSGWAISKSSKNKENAIKFLKFLTSQKSSEYFTNTGLIVPARIDTSKKLNKTEHNEKVFLEVIKKSKNTPVCKNYKKLTDEVNLKYLN